MLETLQQQNNYIYTIHPITQLVVRDWASVYSSLSSYSREELVASLKSLIWRPQSSEDIDQISQIFCHLYLYWDEVERLEDYTLLVDFHEKMNNFHLKNLREMWMDFSKFYHATYLKLAQDRFIESNKQRVSEILEV